MPNFKLHIPNTICSEVELSCFSYEFAGYLVFLFPLQCLFFSFGVQLFCVPGRKRVEDVAKWNCLLLWLASAMSIQSPWGIFLGSFPEKHFPVPTELIRMKLQSLLPSIIFLLCQLNEFLQLQFWQQSGSDRGENQNQNQNKILWYGLQWTWLLIPCQCAVLSPI